MGLLHSVAPSPRPSQGGIAPVPAARRHGRRTALAEGVAIAVAIGLAGSALPGLAVAAQIAPNPNNGTINVNGADDNSVAFTNNGYLNVNATGTLTNNVAASLTNNGTVDIYGGTLNNNGTMTNKYLVENYGTLNNTGTLNDNNAGGGTSGFFNYGALNNSGTLHVDNGGSFYGFYNAFGAAIVNTGTVEVTAPSAIYSGGYIQNQTTGIINNNGILDNYGTITNYGILNINNSTDNYGTIFNYGTLKVDAAGKNGLSQALSATIFNRGDIEVTAGSTLKNYGAGANTSIIQNDGSLKVNGLVQANSIKINGGTVSGTGTLSADLIEIGASASVGPGNSPGTLVFAGDTQFGGTLVIEVDGLAPGQFDVLDATGYTFEFLNGAKIVFDFNFTPAPGDTFVFLLADSIIGWDLVQFSGASGALYLTQTENGLGFIVRGAQVPLPGTLALLPLGLAGLRLVRRRRRAD